MNEPHGPDGTVEGSSATTQLRVPVGVRSVLRSWRLFAILGILAPCR